MLGTQKKKISKTRKSKLYKINHHTFFNTSGLNQFQETKYCQEIIQEYLGNSKI